MKAFLISLLMLTGRVVGQNSIGAPDDTDLKPPFPPPFPRDDEDMKPPFPRDDEAMKPPPPFEEAMKPPFPQDDEYENVKPPLPPPPNYPGRPSGPPERPPAPKYPGRPFGPPSPEKPAAPIVKPDPVADVCYEECKIYTSQLSELDMQRFNTGQDILIAGEPVKFEDGVQVELPNGDKLKMEDGELVRTRDGSIVLDTVKGRPFHISEEMAEKLIKGHNVTVDDDTMILLIGDKIILAGSGKPVLVRVDEGEETDLSDGEIDTLRQRKTIVIDNKEAVLDDDGKLVFEESGKEVNLSNEDREQLDFSSLDEDEIEKLVDGHVISHDDQDIRIIDGQVVRIEDWEEVGISVDDSEKMCYYNCLKEQAVAPVLNETNRYQTQSSSVGVWGLSTLAFILAIN
jgi:hypothetical protein